MHAKYVLKNYVEMIEPLLPMKVCGIQWFVFDSLQLQSV